MSWPAHRTPRYVVARLKEWLWQRQNPYAPWLGPKAVATLENLLKPHMQGVEFGAGRSTGFVAGRVAHLQSWEESPNWFQKTAVGLARKGIQNAVLHLVENTTGIWEEAYAAVLENIQEAQFDFALVDADHGREMLCLHLVPLLKKGGFLMLDNANWYLPSPSYSPHSRTPKQGPATARWAAFLEAVRDWHCIWTSSGVTDTAFWVRG